VGASGRVISVEPSPATAALLRQNIELNGFTWISVVEAALSSDDGEAQLSTSPHSPMWNTLQVGSLTDEAGTITVRTRSLDSLMAEFDCPTLACIKLDVEGAESEVLRGSEQVMARNPNAFWFFEVSGANAERLGASIQTLRWFEKRGYAFRRFKPGGVTGQFS